MGTPGCCMPDECHMLDQMSSRLLGSDACADLQDPEVDAKFGFLYSGYRLYYWESLEMIRKLMLAGIPVFIAVQPTGSSQAVLGEVVLIGFLFATTYFKPYIKLLDNVLAMASLLGEFDWGFWTL